MKDRLIKLLKRSVVLLAVVIVTLLAVRIYQTQARSAS